MTSLTCVLYHNIGDETKFEFGLNVTSRTEAFSRQILWLEKNYDIIDLGSLLTGRLPLKPLLITFDDCFLSSFDAARNVLYPRGLPCIFFINPGLLGSESISLDSALALCANSVGLRRLCAEIGVAMTKNVGELIGKEMSKRTAAERVTLKTHLLQRFGLDTLERRSPILSIADVADFHRYRIEVGNHTRTHVHCRTLNEEESTDEIVAAKRQLETLSGQRVRAFAVPYGHEHDLTDEILSTLRTSGHEAIFLVHARSNRLRPAPDIWYRVNLTNEAPGVLPLKLTVLPILRSFKNMVSA